MAPHVLTRTRPVRFLSSRRDRGGTERAAPTRSHRGLPCAPRWTCGWTMFRLTYLVVVATIFGKTCALQLGPALRRCCSHSRGATVTAGLFDDFMSNFDGTAEESGSCACCTLTSFGWGNIAYTTGEGKRASAQDLVCWPSYQQSGFWGGFGPGKTSSGNEGHTVVPDDVRGMIGEVDHCVFGLGQQGVLKVQPETVRLLESNQVAVYQELTPDAAAVYNELVADGKRVGGLFHSNC